jgi:mono/diheme cytochrome c family protein
LKRVVTVVEVVALVAFCVFVALLFIKEPSTPAPAAASSADGAALFASHCASCHGSDGSGNIGPRLNGGAVVRQFPNAAAEVTLVANGEGRMPAFKTQLSQAQLEAVVAYTRTGLP